MAHIKFNNKFYKDMESEWVDNIKSYINIIKSSATGNLLMEKIAECNRNGCNITIQPLSQYRSSYNYPKITYYRGKKDICIIFPVEPYRSKVSVINQNMLESIDPFDNVCIDYLKKVSTNNDVSTSIVDSMKFKEDFRETKKGFCTHEYQEPFMILAHELIHALRYAMDKYADVYEEEATIFGIENKTLYIDEVKITENQIRKDLNMKMRVDHDGIVDR